MAFEKSTTKDRHIQVLTNTHYISDPDLVRLVGEDRALMLKEDEVVVFQSILKAGFWFCIRWW